MNKPIQLSIVLSLLLTISCSLNAQTVVFDNGAGGAAGMDDGLLSDSDPIPQIGNLELAADDFSVAADTFITNVEWAGVYAFANSPAVDDFEIRIYADNGGPSGTPLASFGVGNNVNRMLTAFNFQGFFNIYSYSAEIGFEATAGVTYWLSIDGQTFADTDDAWFWGSLSTTGNANTSADLGNSWNEFGQSATMVLTGVVDLGDIPGDVNCDGSVDLLDVAPFIDLLSKGGFSSKADINEDGSVDLLDVTPFVELLAG